MKLSIIIPCYNEEKTIEKVITKVLTQKDIVEEVIVIDDSSTDRSKEIISRLSQKDSKIKFFFKDKNEGKGSALIKGFEFNLNYHYENFKIVYDFSLVRGYNLTDKQPLSYMNPIKQILNFEFQNKLMDYNIRLSKVHSQDKLGEFETYTPSSFLVDFILSYNKKNHSITIQLNNILNEEYYNHLSKIKSIMPEAGRNIVLNYKVFF